MNTKICLLICSILMLVQHCVVFGKERNYQVEFMDKRAFCSGAILNEKFILTAAHCFKTTRSDEVMVSFGIENQRMLNVNNKQKIDLNKIIYHEKFDVTTSENDIALVELDKPITFDAHTAPIKLPDSTTKVNDGDQLILTGFKEEKKDQFTLIELEVDVLNNKQCSDDMNRYNLPIYDYMMCTKTKAASVKKNKSCKGISGGTLLLGDVLIGILGYGVQHPDCGSKRIPGVYGRVSFYLDWIKAHAKM